MAEFRIAYDKTKGNEGGFSNVTGDNGGVTYAGITYKNYPGWDGWPRVFAAKPVHNEVLPDLASSVKQFYKTEFWDKVRGDEIGDQEFANDLFDMAVNAGIKAAVRIAQKSVGVPESGIVCNLTLNKINGIA